MAKRRAKKKLKRNKPTRKKTRTKRVGSKKVTLSKKIKRQENIGVVTHYFTKANAAAIRLKKPLSVGDVIRFKGHTTDFQQGVKSLQINRREIRRGKKGDEVGLQVKRRVREHDEVLPGKKNLVSNLLSILPFG